ncbi:GNAT family N-acetyltransferase [Palleniella intestinalis]|uniref:GNAT family N-acetyltransferase n=1 Tax=Palleniella intestinalis TaxID=2736291 RepID=UPI0020A6DAAD|nr:N-acetyltransferase [Palleniella intestinalis]
MNIKNILHNSCTKDTVSIRKACPNDIPRLMEIFSIARKFMKDTGNPCQWPEDYPGKDLLLADICHGDSYVCTSGEEIVATFVLRDGKDPTYNIIYNGAWTNDNPYATIHRIASSGKTKGIFLHVMQYAVRHHDTIRIDTHRDNKPMQHVINKAGFRYCGIIHCWNGDERLAYQYDK